MSTQKLAHGCLKQLSSELPKLRSDQKCPSVGTWINKLWFIQIIEYYLKIKAAMAGVTQVVRMPA